MYMYKYMVSVGASRVPCVCWLPCLFPWFLLPPPIFLRKLVLMNVGSSNTHTITMINYNYVYSRIKLNERGKETKQGQ